MKSALILFGAFDRHNLGDLLFPHIISALLPEQELLFAGLAQRDMRAYGGHQVLAIADIVQHWGQQPANLIHVGGELLDCDLYQAAVMLHTEPEAATIIQRYDADPAAALRWAQQKLGLTQQCGYLADKHWFAHPACFIYNAVGGVKLGSASGTYRQEVLTRLGQADFISVRDTFTRQALAAAGIQSSLQPDCVALLPELFGAQITAHSRRGEVANICRACAGGYLAVQFAAEYGDDASLAAIAAQLALVAKQQHLAIVFFRAGDAPWHDDIDAYRRTAKLLPGIHTRLFQSLNIWDICALLSSCSAFCGTSLHGRIVANSFGRPGVNFADAGKGNKQAAYLQTMSPPDGTRVAPISELTSALQQALSPDRQLLREAALQAAKQARQGYESWRSALFTATGQYARSD